MIQHALVVAAIPDAMPVPEAPRYRGLLADRVREMPVEHASADRSGQPPTWALPVAGLGVALTIVPLVRPLADVAPWLALAGGALVLAAMLGARRP